MYFVSELIDMSEIDPSNDFGMNLDLKRWKIFLWRYLIINSSNELFECFLGSSEFAK